MGTEAGNGATALFADSWVCALVRSKRYRTAPGLREVLSYGCQCLT